jgi:hypothetical protein
LFFALEISVVQSRSFLENAAPTSGKHRLAAYSRPMAAACLTHQ